MSNNSRSRYQFYLDNSVINALSNMSQEIGVSRSQLVRDALQGLVEMYKLKTESNVLSRNYAKLLELSGIIKLDETNLSTRVDEVYLIDQLKEKHGIS